MGLLTGRTAVVTGAGRGIGRAVAIAMAAEGASLGLAARSPREIEQVADEIRMQGGQALAIPTDVARQEDVDALFARVREELGEVDILVDNAAVVGPIGKLWETDPNAWQQVLDINVIGMARCARAVLPGMIARRYGKIIIVGSTAGRSEGWASHCHEQMAYGVSKAAVNRFSEILAAQVREYGINVNCIGVSADTRLGEEALQMAARQRGEPLPRTVEEKPLEQRILPEENIAPFIFLASSLADHITGAYIEANKLPDITRRRAPADEESSMKDRGRTGSRFPPERHLIVGPPLGSGGHRDGS